MTQRTAVLILFLLVGICASGRAQSGAVGSRSAGREYGVNLNVGVYQYDESKSASLESLTRLSGTYSTAGDEISHVKEKYKLEEMAIRHARSVGLRSGETYNDAVLLGPEYMLFTMTPREVVRGLMKLDLKVRYGKEVLLDVTGVDLENFETVLLRGKKGAFGVKFFIGAGGKQDSVPMERTLLLSVTPEIVPLSSLRNRPGEISHPVDEHGNPLRTADTDRFTPPVPLERVTPKFESARAVHGSVLVEGVVTPEGKLSNVRVIRSLDPIIDERAVEAIRQFTFTPGLLNGKPVYATYREEMTFAPPPPSLLDIEEEQRKMIEKEKQTEKRKRRRWPLQSAPALVYDILVF